MFRNREVLLGWAMLGVLFYHACLQGIHIGRLNIGYMGVDIFLLFSGYGIAKSLQKNNLKIFYLNRIKRIFPIFALMTISLGLTKIVFGGVILTTLVTHLSSYQYCHSF